MNKKRCETCKFFDPLRFDGEDDDWGLCRRNAPQPSLAAFADWGESREGDPIAEWPVVATVSWCGEHRQAPR